MSFYRQCTIIIYFYLDELGHEIHHGHSKPQSTKCSYKSTFKSLTNLLICKIKEFIIVCFGKKTIKHIVCNDHGL